MNPDERFVFFICMRFPPYLPSVTGFHRLVLSHSGKGRSDRNSRSGRHWLRLLTCCLMAGSAAPAIAQQSGAWSLASGSGNWSDTANWNGGLVADGAGAAANFNAIDLTSNVTVHLDSARTISSLNFQDTVTPFYNYILDNNGNAANTLWLDGAATISVGVSTTATITAAITGTSGLSFSGATSKGTLILAGNNTYSGVTKIEGSNVGSLQIDSDARLGSSTLTINAQNGGLLFGAAFNDLRDITFGANGGRINTNGFDVTYSSTLSGNLTGGNVIKLGGGTLTLAGNNNITGTGGVVVAGGWLKIDSDARLGNGTGTGTVGALSFQSGSGIIYGAAFDNLRSITLSSAGALDTNGFDVSYSSLISGGGALTKKGAGSLTFTSNQSYTGATTVEAGKLIVKGTMASSGITIGNSASLATAAILAGGGTVGNVTVGAANNNTGATLSPGDGKGVSSGTTLNTGNLSFRTGAHLALQLGRTGAGTVLAGDVSDHVSVTGTVTLTGADLKLSILTGTGYEGKVNDVFYLILNDGTDAVTGVFQSLNGQATDLSEGALFNFNSGVWSITYKANGDGGAVGNDVALTLVVVPEPRALSFVFAGVGTLLFIGQRRRRSATANL